MSPNDEYRVRLSELQREAHPEVSEDEDQLLLEIQETRKLEQRIERIEELGDETGG